jgi:hypothetical protein
MAACWAKYDTIVSDLIKRGLDNQFVDVEAFVLNKPELKREHDAETTETIVIKSMEINCRTFCNQLPVFSRLFGGKNGSACMLSGAVDMLLGQQPLIPDNFASKVVLDVENAERKRQDVGVCVYMDLIPGCPTLVESETKDAAYYGVDGFQAQVRPHNSMFHVAIDIFYCLDFGAR